MKICTFVTNVTFSRNVERIS